MVYVVSFRKGSGIKKTYNSSDKNHIPSQIMRDSIPIFISVRLYHCFEPKNILVFVLLSKTKKYKKSYTTQYILVQSAVQLR